MKKRILILLLAVMAVVCIALSACITDHVHNFGKDWKVCKIPHFCVKTHLQTASYSV